MSGIKFLKGHGTENDFVLLPDPDGTLTVSDLQVRALCDRRAGIGGDGILRIAPAGDGTFLMDYRNADGSPAQMCGNGARVFARFLVDAGWQAAGDFEFQTRGGTRRASLGPTGDVSIDMGPAGVGVASSVGSALTSGRSRDFAGVTVDVGNPHLVAFTDLDLAELDLTAQPSFDASVFQSGVNIEFVNVLAENDVAMRVHERGVGETRSCGTGTVAVAAAYLAAGGRSAGTVKVRVPGGTLIVRIEDGQSYLTGPAVIVGAGEIDAAWWSNLDQTGAASGSFLSRHRGEI